MLPRLEISDHILVNKFIYRFKEPKHGDIIVFKSPPAATQGVSYMGKDQALIDWNVVVGNVVGPYGDTGEVEVKPESEYKDQYGDYPALCATSNDIGYQVLDVAKFRKDGANIIVRFAGINNAAEAESLKGAEVRVGEKDYIKRLIGLPGDTIQVKNGAVYRNGQRLKEPYMAEPDQINYVFGPYKVPPGKLFMMGDNRNDSNDSHVWGPLDRSRIVGKAWVRFWPLYRIGLVK